ncbi:MAG TPA: TRAP transporter small permease [Acidovorax sp.]|jgi:TRAP-type C4-dicarboxylate transport system permease small subunit|nr:TRAP transporter small permease [Acidovorax sp.]
MDQLTRYFYRLLITLACVSMVAAFVIVMLGILARQVTFINIQGLDAYAGYAIAATLFFALPTALMHGDHIRVTLVLDRLGQRARAGFEWGALIAALGLAVYLAWFAMRAVWLSYITHDVSPAADATPLWIPQLSMAIGCVAFALAFLDAIVARWRGREWFIAGPGSVAE